MCRLTVAGGVLPNEMRKIDICPSRQPFNESFSLEQKWTKLMPARFLPKLTFRDRYLRQNIFIKIKDNGRPNKLQLLFNFKKLIG